jgi:hypothetical protein
LFALNVLSQFFLIVLAAHAAATEEKRLFQLNKLHNSGKARRGSFHIV